MENKKKVVIIGAGVSGLTAGIYALDNNFDVTIYEKHIIAGGQCTGWERKGVHIDGCAHWIVGTSPKSDLYPLWKHIGAFDSTTTIHETEYFSKIDIDGEIFTFYADLEKLKEEMLRVAPEDKKQINRFIKGIKAYMHVQIPTKKPIDHYNFFELTAFGIKMLPMVFHFLRYKHMSIETYATKFKSKILQEAFNRVMTDNFNIHSFVYVMKSLAKQDAGVIEGGSRQVAKNVEKRFIEKGGTLITNKEIARIIVEDNVAKGVVFKDQKEDYADYIISAADAHHTLYTLLQDKYEDKYFTSRFGDRKINPLSTSILVSFKINKLLNHFPKMIDFKIPNIKIGPMDITDLSIRNHSFDNTLNEDKTTITVLINTTDGVYDYLKSLNRKEYLKEKEELGLKVRDEIIKYVNLDEKDIELVDVATPLTYERYTNAYRGSYMSFVTTDKTKGLMRKGLIKGLDNFVLAGQWIMSPGGLPIALFSGKHAAIRVCKMAKRKFKNLEE